LNHAATKYHVFPASKAGIACSYPAFVSRSRRDLEQVREIRDGLERRGHNPLRFFRKCLSDGDLKKG
jgi:hypothetical protein